MRRYLPTLILAVVAAKGVAQTGSPQKDPVLDAEKHTAAKVESQAHIKNMDLKSTIPAVRMDAGPALSFYGMGKGNVVHEEHWEKVPAPEQASFNQWAAYTADEQTGRALFEDMFYRFFFVHELGHWMQDEVLRQRRDPMAKQADRNSEQARWQYETVANRISVAWWREHDPQYLAKLVNDFRAIEAKLPNPVPSGEAPSHFFAREYKVISDDPNAYGWFQLRMVISAYDEQPINTFRQAINTLLTENYDK
jgi:hypothetical protein